MRARSRNRDRRRRGQDGERGPAADQGELVPFGFEVVEGDAELFDVSEPLLPFSLVDALKQVLLNSLETPVLVCGNVEVVAADTGVFVAASAAIRPDAVAEFDPASPEVLSWTVTDSVDTRRGCRSS